jgi:hypothetical protein
VPLRRTLSAAIGALVLVFVVLDFFFLLVFFLVPLALVAQETRGLRDG